MKKNIFIIILLLIITFFYFYSSIKSNEAQKNLLGAEKAMSLAQENAARADEQTQKDLEASAEAVRFRNLLNECQSN